MKTLKLSSLFMLLSLLSMGMGFPDIISEREIIELKKSKKQKEMIKAQMSSCSREIYVTESHKPKQVSKKKSCIQTCSQPNQATTSIVDESFMSEAFSSLKIRVLKVFDKIGNLLVRHLMHIGNFFRGSSEAANLPDQSNFVMHRGNTIHYFLDSKNLYL